MFNVKSALLNQRSLEQTRSTTEHKTNYFNVKGHWMTISCAKPFFIEFMLSCTLLGSHVCRPGYETDQAYCTIVSIYTNIKEHYCQAIQRGDI